jgi:hypothetical protein
MAAAQKPTPFSAVAAREEVFRTSFEGFGTRHEEPEGIRQPADHIERETDCERILDLLTRTAGSEDDVLQAAMKTYIIGMATCQMKLFPDWQNHLARIFALRHEFAHDGNSKTESESFRGLGLYAASFSGACSSALLQIHLKSGKWNLWHGNFAGRRPYSTYMDVDKSEGPWGTWDIRA